MADREKYIEVLSKAAKTVKEFNEDAPIKISLKCIEDILELLKEQEAKPQRYEEHDIFHFPLCPKENCNAVIKKEWHYCPYCKQAIQWDDALAERINAEGR